jgi:hypothetical protein
MERILTVATAAAALLFSLGLAALVEELIFGGLFRCFFAPRTAHPQKQTKLGQDQGQGEL